MRSIATRDTLISAGIIELVEVPYAPSFDIGQSLGAAAHMGQGRVKPKRPLDPEQLKPLFGSRVRTRVVRDPLRAMELVMGQAAENEVVLVTGSVYLIGEVYPWFLARAGRRGLFPEAQP